MSTSTRITRLGALSIREHRRRKQQVLLGPAVSPTPPLDPQRQPVIGTRVSDRFHTGPIVEVVRRCQNLQNLLLQMVAYLGPSGVSGGGVARLSLSLSKVQTLGSGLPVFRRLLCSPYGTPGRQAHIAPATGHAQFSKPFTPRRALLPEGRRQVGRILKLGMVTQWYDPEEGSACVPGTIARALLRRGISTSVVTGFPNYPYGKLYSGYSLRPSQREVLDGIPVHRVALYPSHERSPLRRILSYLSFAGSASTFGLGSLLRCDVGLVYSTPATTAIPALVAKALRRVPFVLFIQDLWPETVLASGMLNDSPTTRRLEWALHRFCNQVYRSADRIAVISAGMRQLLIERGVPATKIDVVHNWVDEALFRPVALDRGLQAELAIDGKFSVMYAGMLGDLQGLEVAIRAATMVADIDDFRLVLVGSGVAEPRLRQMVLDAGLKNVIFVGQRRLSEMSALLRAADVQLITLRDLPLFHATMPSKVQCVLSAGRPVISSVPGDAGDLIRRSGAGIACPPEDAGALAGAIRTMHAMTPAERERMGAAGHEFYQSQLSEQVGSARLVRLLEEAAR